MLSNKTYVIAEMACSHDGHVSFAKEIIDAAGRAKADAIQFQIWSLRDLLVSGHTSWKVLKEIELSYESWQELFLYSKSNYPKMDIIACVYEPQSVKFAEKMGADAYKIHRSDLMNKDFIDRVAAINKRIDLSVGAATLEEIKNTIDHIRSQFSTEIWLMYGYQNFPTRIDDVHLNFLLKLKEHFGLPFGYQDHTDANLLSAFTIPAAAVGKGISIIEKHITHDRSYAGCDYQAALNPDEFENFMQIIRDIDLAKGAPDFPRELSEEEYQYRDYGVKSIVAAKELPAGHTLQKEDLLLLRANSLGMKAEKVKDVLGRKINKPLFAHENILEDFLV